MHNHAAVLQYGVCGDSSVGYGQISLLLDCPDRLQMYDVTQHVLASLRRHYWHAGECLESNNKQQPAADNVIHQVRLKGCRERPSACLYFRYYYCVASVRGLSCAVSARPSAHDVSQKSQGDHQMKVALLAGECLLVLMYKIMCMCKQESKCSSGSSTLSTCMEYVVVRSYNRIDMPYLCHICTYDRKHVYLPPLPHHHAVHGDVDNNEPGLAWMVQPSACMDACMHAWLAWHHMLVARRVID